MPERWPGACRTNALRYSSDLVQGWVQTLGADKHWDGMELNAALDLVDGWVQEGVVPGAAIVVARHGRLVGERYAGRQSAGGGRAVDATTRYPIGSLTTLFTATAALRLVERGEISLDEPVRRLVPAFAGAARRDVTIRDLLRHTSGLPAGDPAEERLWAAHADFAAMAASSAALPLVWPAGERVACSAPGSWVLGAAIGGVAGAPFADVLRVEVLDRFGLRETLLDPPPSIADQIARRYGREKVMNEPYGRSLDSPAGGLVATARDLVRFASVFLAGGLLPDGTRALSQATVDAMTTDQTGGLPGGIEGLGFWPVCPWGLGWEIKGTQRRHWTGDLTSPRTVSLPGHSGALLWADPSTGIAGAVLANRDVSTGWTTTPARWARLGNAVVAAVTSSATPTSSQQRGASPR